MGKFKALFKNATVERISDDLISTSSKNFDLIETRHQQIMEGACHVFFEKGYHPTTIRDIAKTCGMSMGQLYHYISSKDDILYLVHKNMQKIWYEYLRRSGFEEVKDPIERLRKALRSSLKFTFENKKLIQFLYSESKYLDKEHLKVVLTLDDVNVVGFWRKILSEVFEKKRIKRDINFTANLVAYMIVFLPLRGWNFRNKTTEENMDRLVEFIWRALGLDEKGEQKRRGNVKCRT
jgi:AcrR family transcriptional regulator